MKSKAVQRRYRASKRLACGLCKSHQRGWADKKAHRYLRRAIGQEQQVRDWEKGINASNS